jgi:hypothetical protein
MTVAARHGELAGHLHGYTPELLVRGVMQTAADRRLTYGRLGVHSSQASSHRPPPSNHTIPARQELFVGSPAGR